jgi:tetratricopeptide (TPR) repeat protein
VPAAEVLLQTAELSGDTGQILEAHHSFWPTLSAMGEAKAAVPHMERGVTLYVREQHAAQAFVYGGHDAGACCRWHLAMNRWLLGFPERALSDMKDALRLAGELQHPQTTGLALSFAAWVRFQRGEHDTAAEIAERLADLANAHGFGPYLDYAMVLRHAIGDRHDVKALESVRLGAQTLSQWRRAFCVCAIAQRYARAGFADQGRAILKSLAEAERRTFYAPEVLRVEGDLILKSAAPDIDQAERRFQAAIDLARKREEKSLELRAAISLARLWQQQRRRREAHELLTGIYSWFTEGFDTADLRSARELLKELA